MERSRLATLAFCGSYAGAVVGLPMSGVLTSHLGWQAPFYFYGAVGLIWYAFWLWLSFERPSKHPNISKEECDYIESCIGQVSHKPPTVRTSCPKTTMQQRVRRRCCSEACLLTIPALTDTVRLNSLESYIDLEAGLGH